LYFPRRNNTKVDLVCQADVNTQDPANFIVVESVKFFENDVKTLTNRLEDGKVRYDLVEMENLRLFFLSVIEVIDRARAGGGTAKEPEPPPGKKMSLA